MSSGPGAGLCHDRVVGTPRIARRLPSITARAAAAIAAHEQVALFVAAAVADVRPHPAAEDIAVLDHISNGRVSYVFGLGYRPESSRSTASR
jgi:alkanesulfonate monooxygenase SsuD/methylene tetrahydromethanopterin reductase-like flavin-dependent oxidoreductase (luciferase family)